MDKSIIVFCPNPYSLYTNSVCELLVRKGYTIDAIIVRKFTLSRFKNEFARDGKRLIKKIWKKLFLKDKAYAPSPNNIVGFRKKNKLTISNAQQFAQSGTKLIRCITLNDKIVEDTLQQFENKIVVFTGGGIIRENILRVAGDGIINCHMGVLPKYKGMDLPEWCMLENEPEQLGMTLHFMDQGVDTGNILKIVHVPLEKGDTIKSIREKFEPIMVESMVQVVEDWLGGSITPIKQPSQDNRQYFIMHERLLQLVDDKLYKYKR